jgi:hypothetical protein
MRDRGRDKWDRACWYAGLGAIVGGAMGYALGWAIGGAEHQGVIVGALLGSTTGSFLGRPGSLASGYLIGMLSAGAYLLGGMIAMTQVGMFWPRAFAFCDLFALASASLAALGLPLLLTRGPFPGSR